MPAGFQVDNTSLCLGLGEPQLGGFPFRFPCETTPRGLLSKGKTRRHSLARFGILVAHVQLAFVYPPNQWFPSHFPSTATPQRFPQAKLSGASKPTHTMRPGQTLGIKAKNQGGCCFKNQTQLLGFWLRNLAAHPI